MPLMSEAFRRVTDKATAKDNAVSYYTVEQLSPNLHTTPEGFLLCRDVPIARTGSQLYADYEAPNIEARGGVVRIEREPEEVFNSNTIASFEGKPVTDDHPEEDVSPDNWKQLAVGVVQNVRRGIGYDDKLLFADLLITDRKAIEAVRGGKREVSCGYDAEFEQIEPGRGRQKDIRGNHVALVDRGRCGAKCAIKDNQPSKGLIMAKKSFKDAILDAFRTRDESALTKAIEDAEGEGATIHLHTNDGKTVDGALDKRMTAVEDGIAELLKANKRRDEEAEAEKKKADDKRKDEEEAEENRKKAEDAEKELTEGGEKEKAKDAAGVAVLYSDLKSRAEIIAPGISLLKVSDKAIKDGKALDALCIIKRRALDAAMNVEASKKALSPFLGGKTVDALSCSAVDAAFIGASEVMKASNNSRLVTQHKATDAQTLNVYDSKAVNKFNRDYWNKLEKGEK